MDFYCVSTDSAEDYKGFILSHENAAKTEKAAWIEAMKSGKRVWPYSMSMLEEEPLRVVYFEFVDEDINIYVDFFNYDTEEWLESYTFFDSALAWTIVVDNEVAGDPLGLGYSRMEAEPQKEERV